MSEIELVIHHTQTHKGFILVYAYPEGELKDTWERITKIKPVKLKLS